MNTCEVGLEPTGGQVGRFEGAPSIGSAAVTLVLRARGALLVVALAQAVFASAVGESSGQDRIDLRKRFGFDPLKRTPLVMIYRMDLAGNDNGVLEANEIPAGARDYVDGVLAEARMRAAGPVRLDRLAVGWQTYAAKVPPRLPESFAIHRKTAAGDSGSTGPARPNLDELEDLAGKVVACYDRDGDDCLERREWKDVDPSWDHDDDGRVSVRELAAAFDRIEAEAAARAAGPAGSEPEITRRQASPESYESQPAGRTRDPRGPVIRFHSPRERLPAGLPAWFVERDADGDGQVMMSEYAREWTDEKVSQFYRYDLNRDGVVTPRECLTAGKQN